MSNELNTQLQQQLRGLAMPDTVSWWPLAIGWWVLIILFLVIATFFIVKLLRHNKQQKYRRVALHELESSLIKWQKNSRQDHYLYACNSILKRVMRHLNADNTNISGKKWGIDLNKYSNKPLSAPTLSALCEQCYQPNPNVNIEQLHTELKSWLNTHRKPNMENKNA